MDRVKIAAILFLSFASERLILSNPLNNRSPSDWSEVVVSKQVFDEKGKIIGEPEIQVFVNPRKCNYTIGKFVRLPCVKTDFQEPDKDLVNDSSNFEANNVKEENVHNRTVKTFKFDVPMLPGKSDEYIIQRNTVLKTPRLQCPPGQKLDLVDNCRQISVW